MDYTLRPDPTLKGYMDRNQPVYGKCIGKDCQRKASLDMRELLRLTGPNLHLSKIADYMRCARLEGCRFTFTSLEPRCTIPLERYLGHRNVRLRLRCGRCQAFTHRPVEAVIAWLETSGRGSKRTLIDDVQRMLEAKCGCGSRRWTIEVIIFDVSNPRWREKGEGVFKDRPWAG
ncbi:MAG: hypothetical protein EON95_20075 [Caulobacteraceae bacterium]|nr:MAG: hypothetical protein EON95_20075 [Caulobacteraceae bacterium]